MKVHLQHVVLRRSSTPEVEDLTYRILFESGKGYALFENGIAMGNEFVALVAAGEEFGYFKASPDDEGFFALLFSFLLAFIVVPRAKVLETLSGRLKD